MSILFGLSIIVISISVFLSCWRLIQGPTVFDRVLGFDSLSISIIAGIIILSALWKTSLYIDAILIFSLFGFLGSLSFCFYLNKSYPESKHHE
ncbi:MAG: monovalent cation/H+ antiporter complex subunit F [Candidatus Marinamargulisbacteria bacterium]|nr:K+/H+ antiporter subunit F [bacterium]MDG2264540.1 monovalent cation/H+ antiporter complex subunit F [Candidatus Marinamargulisbacteria bacterium]|tara:strand:+ start:3771 stop:4049 length:279 start_codon:yes stop_codon:yes gene_type:complete